MTTTTAIHFDRETGRLIGTEMPAIPDLIEGMKRLGLKAEKAIAWLPESRCGCLLGLSAILKLSPDAEPAGHFLLTDSAIEILDLPADVANAIIDTFDSRANGYFGDDGEQAANYAYEAAMAIGRAGLWHRPARDLRPR